MKEWFEEWFDTKYYHILYKNRNYEDASRLINSLEKKLQFKSSQLICDLCCGKGRHSLYLNKKGYSVIGLDLSENNILEASKHESENLRFFVHDMRDLFQKDKFDVVLNLFTSFGYFSDDEQNQLVVNAIAASMKQNASVCIDYMNSTKAVENLSLNYEKSIEGLNFKINKEIKEGFIIKNIQFEDQGKGYDYYERVKIINLEDFNTYFEKAGLKITDVYGDYDLNKYDKKTSDRLIVIAQKNNY
jgi:SAM-dependent methyltransferase